MLLSQSTSGCLDEGAAGGDDCPFSTSDPSVVPKQALQRQEGANSNARETNSKRMCKCFLKLL